MTMMTMFKGAYTALVPPFAADGSIDEQALRKLVEAQIAGGIDGIVPCGTTGESPTITVEEQERIFRIAVSQAKGRCTVIAGAGANSTEEAIRLTQYAKDAGCDATLHVSPYYNKPTQEGLFRHFRAVADAVDIPIILYNIKGRTAVNIETETLLRLSAVKNIAGVKEASGDISQIMDVIGSVPQGFTVLSGDDNLTFPLMALGGHGVVSVASNLVPGEVSQMVHAMLKKDVEKARALHYRLLPLFKAIFIETNPIPIKAAMAMRGMIEETYRLPLCEMQPKNRERLKAALGKLGIL